jgi:hypothetical protein
MPNASFEEVIEGALGLAVIGFMNAAWRAE